METKEKFTVNYNDILKEVLTENGIISECYTMFHDYSITNQFLACVQLKFMGLPIKPIACASAWKKQGRYVKEEEKENPIWLRMPITKKYMDTDEEGNEVENFRTFYAFKPNWYSFTQTYNPKNKKMFIIRPTINFDIDKVIKANNIKKIEFETVNGNPQGYCYPENKEYAINPLAENELKTTIHEVAHILLKHHSDDMSKSLHELEAESVAYIVLSVVKGASETDLEKMRGYIQAWFRGNVIPEKNAKRIMTVADTIIKVGLGK